MKKPKTRAAFTDGSAPAPETMAVDATPRAGDSLRAPVRAGLLTLPNGATVRTFSADEPEEG